MQDESDDSLLSEEETIIPIKSNVKMDTLTTTKTKPTTIYTIPGLNGTGGSAEYLHTIFDKESTNIVKLKTPRHKIDLGQQSCINTLNESMISNNKNSIQIVHASSQGTATLMNLLCTDYHGGNFVKCVILEAVLASGNSAIYHTLTTRMKFLKCIPFGYYLLPYIVKLVRFPLYRPAGIQLVKSLNDKNCRLNKDMLVIILHSTGDKQLSVSNAYAVYYKLKQLGMKNVYMNIKHGDTSHSHLIRNNEDADMLRIILDAHGYAKMNELEKFNIMSKYYNKNPDKFKTIVDIVNLWKPSDDNNLFKVYYDNLLDSEKNHKYLEWYIIFMIILLIVYLVIIIFIPSSASAATSTSIIETQIEYI